MKCYHKKAVEVVPPVKDLKEKEKRIGEPEKWEEKERRKYYVNNIQKERLMTEMRTKEVCG